MPSSVAPTVGDIYRHTTQRLALQYRISHHAHPHCRGASILATAWAFLRRPKHGAIGINRQALDTCKSIYRTHLRLTRRGSGSGKTSLGAPGVRTRECARGQWLLTRYGGTRRDTWESRRM